MKVSSLLLINLLFLPQSVQTAVPCSHDEYVFSESIGDERLCNQNNDLAASKEEQIKRSEEISEIIRLYTRTVINHIRKTSDSNNEEELIAFVKQNNHTPLFLTALSRLFSNDAFAREQRLFIEIMLGSDIEIFDYWYKIILTIASRSENESLSRRASDILDYYKEDFDGINLSDVLD